MKIFPKNSKVIVEIITEIAPGRLTQSKMICIKELIDSKLFKMPECRQILLPVFCQQIKDKLESKEEVRKFIYNRIMFFIFVFMFVVECNAIIKREKRNKNYASQHLITQLQNCHNN